MWRIDASRGPSDAGPSEDTPVRMETPAASDAGGAVHRHGDQIHAHAEPHPHDRGSSGAPTVGIVGAGPVGTALGVAISRAGWPVTAVASRDVGRRDRFRSLVPGARAFMEATAVVDEVELVILAVPDDAIESVVEPLRLFGGQTLIHTSGLLGADVLAPALSAGSHIGAFHPLVSFTLDVERSAAALRGATVALEGDDSVMGLLADLAEAIGGVAVRLPRGTKPAYHAAAVMASGGLVALLDAIVTLGAAAGLDERGALAVYGRLMEQTLANARANGVASALTGPIVRGDVGTVEAHLASLAQLAPGVLDMYRAAGRREVEIAGERGTLSPEQLDRVRAALAKVP
jgi:predicted short-subunit dehydrogenase-like oxidoreductase (DUF2520 family)